MASKTPDARGRPPLPPRQSQATSATTPASPAQDAPPPYELIAQQQRAYEKATAPVETESSSGLMQNDPRSSSQESLLPKYEEHDRRRTLLLVYIHGFMGNETSFRSFPAHVHNLLVILLAETHVVHTKIYPRYKSRGHISIARDGFGKWLAPHESDKVDVILLGHSMGGLLAAEVALRPPPRPASRPLAHRIVGTINFDVPFLGMHPGVVRSGLSSIFKPSEDTHQDQWVDHSEGTGVAGSSDSATPASPPQRMDTLWAPGQADPNYNPAYQNDVNLPVRKGWSNAWHFINKHSGELVKSTKKLVSSHLEFGGAMANYGELKARYARIRALEEPDERVRKSVVEGGTPPRVRFVNYYTASTGRPKKPASRKASPSPHGSRAPSAASSSRTPAPPDMPASDPNQSWGDAMESLKIGELQGSESSVPRIEKSSSSPVILPAKPPPLGDLSYIQDTKIREMVEAEHAKAVEAYETAVATQHSESKSSHHNVSGLSPAQIETPQPPKQKPESEMTHSERENLRLEKERQRMEAEARRMRGEKEPERPAPQSMLSSESTRTTESRAGSLAGASLTTIDSTATQDSKVDEDGKPKKDRKFCVLPPKDASGQRDPCWVRIFMENVDEVGAHCGLFFVDERYERLVGDVAERIEHWVREDNGLGVPRGAKS